MAAAGFRAPAAFLSDCLLAVPETAAEAARQADGFRKKQKDLENALLCRSHHQVEIGACSGQQAG